MRSFILLLSFVWLLAGCATIAEEEPWPTTDESVTTEDGSASPTVEASAPASDSAAELGADGEAVAMDAVSSDDDIDETEYTKPRLTKKRAPLDPDAVALLNSSTFKKQFMESYMAETEIEPRIDLEELAELEKIMGYMAAEKLDRAEKALQKMRRKASASAVFDLTIASLWFQQERLDEAEEALLIAIDKHAKFRRAWKNLAVIHFKRGDFAATIPPLTEVIKLGGADVVTYGMLGICYSNIEDSLAAETAFRMAILLDPSSIDWKRGLARSLFEQQRFGDAVALTDRLIAEYPERADFWVLQANAFIGLGQTMRAAQNYEMVDRLGKASVQSLTSLADIYINEKLFDMAVEAYTRAMRMEPEKGDPKRQIHAARVLTANGALDEARHLIAEIDDVYGDRLEQGQQTELLWIRAKVALADEASDEEARVLEEIVRLDPLDGKALIQLAMHARRTEQPELAGIYYERAAAIEEFEAEAKLRHAQLLAAEGKYAEAMPLLKRAYDLNPQDSVQVFMKDVESRIAR